MEAQDEQPSECHTLGLEAAARSFPDKLADTFLNMSTPQKEWMYSIMTSKRRKQDKKSAELFQAR